ncbi:MAG TPA: hypothetical protein VK603_19990, partial [Candidatus Saccharimonadales bacterium]|nr:hypothetical protein [Candidatus Saccharimonadales bacterium]
GLSKGDAKACIIEATQRSVSDYKQSLRNRESFSRNVLFTQERFCRARAAFSGALSAPWCVSRGLPVDGYEIIKANCKEVYRDAFFSMKLSEVYRSLVLHGYVIEVKKLSYRRMSIWPKQIVSNMHAVIRTGVIRSLFAVGE